MAKTATLSVSDAKKIVLELERLEEIRDRILRIVPMELLPKGSNLRWIKEAIEGEDEIRKGKYTRIRNDAELKEFFDNL
ncbi:MAG: hypothetical protein A3C27_03760 [Candidatus Levybacteria bacterium RIFCSPHIGHO2_02_FULL_39_36]|nr:MAG: hypothetical protein A3C27_03760 [Candidatus Levybacteria bacterium RIFCSPHIGHO2_02_FULL_39_36]OGH45613.1 MAG: hypothetical protein A3H82_00030 [Candidatus Levybacteria bacterium RIFCSPLOWO2_02_FULL_39_26]OGH47787.1 MAG: hypothetical protein A3G66_01885 [Candidatus Levybacteria bacterium RIFCSPLOWO2_12_FULL_39_17]